MTAWPRAALPWALAACCLLYDPAALAASPKRCMGLFVAMAFLAWRLLASEKLRLPRAAFALLVAVAWLGVSALHGAAGRWLVLSNWWLGGALVLAVSGLEADVRRALASRTALLVALGISLALGVSWCFGLRGLQLHAGQGNPNWAGLVLALAWPLARNDALLGRLGRVFGVGFSLLCVVGLVLSESRVAWVASALGWLVLALSRGARRHALLELGILGAAVALTTLPRSTPPNAVGVTAQRQPAPVDRSARTSLAGRLWIQRVAARAALEQAPFGCGLGGFFPVFLEEQGRALGRLSPRAASQRFSNATTAHDDWLELGVEAGPLAPLLLLLAFGLALRASDSNSRAALVSVAIAALGDSPFHLPAVCVLLALLFGALPADVAWLRSRAPLLLALGMCGFLLSRSLAEWASTRLASEARAADPTARGKLLLRAERLMPESSERALELGLWFRERDEMGKALVALERAVRLGGDVASYVALGAAALDASDVARAGAAFSAALARNPGSVRAHAGLSEALRRAGHFEEAEAHARVALELLPGDMQLRAQLDAIREQRVDRELEQSN